MPLFEIPLGTTVHNVELKIGRGGQLARSAGTGIQVVAKEGNYVTLRLRSTEMRMVRGECLATIGEVGNPEHELLSIGKAGKSRWLGRNPRVRGVAMNPVDHPLGGGEGKTSGGRPPTNPWGKVEGKKTRHKKKPSTKLIVRGRQRGKATPQWDAASRRGRRRRRRSAPQGVVAHGSASDSADGAPVGAEDAPRDRPDPGAGGAAGVRHPAVLEEAGREADPQGAQVGGGERRAARAAREHGARRGPAARQVRGRERRADPQAVHPGGDGPRH